MNLLDKASIILTPTAYNNGEALCVKPSDGSGDFDFSRNSAATRVNAQGLVEDVQILSSNLVQNGDFSEQGAEEVSNGSFTNGSTDWVLGTGWSIGEDKAVLTNVGYNVNCTQSNVTTIGQYYKIEFTISDYISGQIRISLGGNATSLVSANGTYVFYLQATINNVLVLQPLSSDTNLSITNISVKEVGQNWTLGTGWSIGDDEATCDGTQTSSSILQQNSVFTSGKFYQIQLGVTSYTSGSLEVSLHSVWSSSVASVGTYTFFINATTDWLRIQADASFIGSITNISVIEITDDTNLPRINYEGFSYQDALGSELVLNGTFDSNINFWNKGGGNVNPLSWDNGKIKITNDVAQLNSARQTIATEIGKTYKVSADVNSTNGLTPRLSSSNPTTALIGTLGTIETLTYTFIATSTSSQIELFNWQNTIDKYNLWDNVSVKEVLGQEVVPDSGCGSWLFEPQSTNLVTQSELLNGYWSNPGSNNSISDVISPDGISFSQKVTTTTAGNFKGLLKTESTNWDSKTLTISTFAKKGNTDWLYFYNIGSNNGNNGVWFNLDSGLIGTIGAAWSNVKIETFQNGWYRCCATLSFGAATNYLYILNSDANNSVFSTLDNYAYIWGTQIEENNISSYIPTSGTSVTRNQDVCTNGGSVSTINSTEGVLYAEVAALANDGTFRMINISDGTLNNRIEISYSSTDNLMRVFCYVNGATVATKSNISANVLDFNKIAFSYKENDFKAYLNGVNVFTDTSGAIYAPNTLNRIDFGAPLTSGFNFYGKTKALAVWKEALSDEELTLLTTI